MQITKKNLAAFILSGVLLFSACLSQSESNDSDSSPDKAGQSNIQGNEITATIDGYPPWLLSPPREEGYVFGIGGASDLETAKQKAIVNAAQQFAVSVKTSLYRQDVMGKELKNEVIVTMDEQLTDHLIRGVKYYDSFTDDFGYSWILSRAPLECSLDVAESLLLSYLFEMKQNPEQGRRIMDSTERDFLERRKETAQMSIEDMVLIRGGTYRSALTGDNTELESFLVSSHETTQGEWALVMEPLPEGLDYGRGDEFPVYNVSWDESVEFCNRLSIRDGLTPCYVKDGDEYQCFFQADGYRLPTAIEWEFAAFAKAASTGWSSENSGGAVHRVGSMSGEFNQLHDMAGNVWEWCWEWYDEDETMRIIKGGGWNSPNRDLSFMDSGRVYPDEADPSVGFRVVRSLR